MHADLAPIAAGSSYGMWDAAIILFREGFEALLVVAALVAFLQKSGNADKRRWIWMGGAAGIAASIVVAIMAQFILNRAMANVSREVLEGVIGLFAAAMLLYVGYWLHSKASLAGWQQYIHTQSTAAIERNNLFGLAFIAFLAVFREGAETVLFYIGIAPSISTADLLTGLGVGAAGLVVLAVVMLVLGVRLPIRPFFMVATVLIYYLCLKFVGMGIHALQITGRCTGYACAVGARLRPVRDLSDLGEHPGPVSSAVADPKLGSGSSAVPPSHHTGRRALGMGKGPRPPLGDGGPCPPAGDFNARLTDQPQHPQPAVDVAGDHQIPLDGDAPHLGPVAQIVTDRLGCGAWWWHPGRDLSRSRWVADIQDPHSVGEPGNEQQVALNDGVVR